VSSVELHELLVGRCSLRAWRSTRSAVSCISTTHRSTIWLRARPPSWPVVVYYRARVIGRGSVEIVARRGERRPPTGKRAERRWPRCRRAALRSGSCWKARNIHERGQEREGGPQGCRGWRRCVRAPGLSTAPGAERDGGSRRRDDRCGRDEEPITRARAMLTTAAPKQTDGRGSVSREPAVMPPAKGAEAR